MKVKSVNYNKMNQPAGATIKFTATELALIYRLFGHVRTVDLADTFGHDVSMIGNKIAVEMGNLLNGFSEDGVNDILDAGRRLSWVPVDK